LPFNSPAAGRIFKPVAPTIQRTISVHFNHRVFFTERVFEPRNLLLQIVLTESGIPARALVILDEGLAQAQPHLAGDVESYFSAFAGRLNLVCPPLVVEGGERAKTSYFHVSEIHSRIERFHIDRHSYVVGVGGGALLDVVGLAAATAHRGVRHIRIPTTTLGQNDAGVGVKNGINAFGKKNFIGSFAPPHAVINDLAFLATLTEREQRAGYAEAIKVALICDHDFFVELENSAPALARFQPAAVRRMIERCATLHVNHIADAGDPFETGSARPLDFGHWAAHKLEQLSDHRLRHGEVVAIGIAVDALYSRNIGWLAAASCERILRALKNLGFNLFAHELCHMNDAEQLTLLQGLEEFREHLGGQLTLTMLRAIGESAEIHEVVVPKMVDAIGELRRRHEAEESQIVAAQA
jgi:3-dehydroquinate synthase